MYYIKPVALAQADLYGYFFRRDTKRVQIHIVEGGVTKTWEEGVDINHALETVDKFKVLNEGAVALPPKNGNARLVSSKRDADYGGNRVKKARLRPTTVTNAPYA